MAGEIGRISNLVLAIALLAGCAQSTEKTLTIRNVGGDLWIRSIGSDNSNAPEDGGTQIDGRSSAIPVTGFPEILIGVAGKGIFSDYSVMIRSVSGSVYIEEAGNRNQQQDAVDILDHLFIPGNPFDMNQGITAIQDLNSRKPE